MEWLALVLWLLIVGLALPLGVGAIAQPAFGLVALAAPAAFALILAFIIFDAQEWMAWAAFGSAVVATIAAGVGAAWIVDGYRSISHVGQTVEETLAAIVGMELPLLGVASLVNLAVALGMTAA
jgi:hypothetical protein